jgi:hypothetical protein
MISQHIGWWQIRHFRSHTVSRAFLLTSLGVSTAYGIDTDCV